MYDRFRDLTFDDHCWIDNNAVFGKGCKVGMYSYVGAAVIGNNVTIGPCVHIPDKTVIPDGVTVLAVNTFADESASAEEIFEEIKAKRGRPKKR